MKTILETSRCPALVIKLARYTFIGALAITPGVVLAAKAGDTPSNQMAVNPRTTQSVNINAATQRPNTLPKVEPITDKRPPRIPGNNLQDGGGPNRNPSINIVKPHAKVNHIKPSMIPLPDAARSNAGKKTPNPNLTAPAANMPAGVGRLPADARMGNAAAIQDVNQAHGIIDVKAAAEAAHNLPGMPERTEGIIPDLGLGGNGPTGPNGNPLDMSKLPGHVTGYEKPPGSEYVPDMPNNQDKGPSNSWLRPSGDLRGIMGGADGLHKVNVPKTGVQGMRRTSVNTGDGGSVITHTWRDNEGMNQTQHDVFNSDGTSASERITNNPDGSRSRVRVEYDENGNATDLQEEARLPDSDPAGNPDPDSDGGGGMVLPSERRPNFSVKLRDKIVNPGPDGATPNPQASRLTVPEDQLVINPNPNDAGGQGATPDARTYEMMRRKLEGIGPDPRPGPDDGGGRGGAIEAVVPEG